MTLSSKIVLVTPQKAKEWLQHQHPHQRPIRPGTVARYAEEMRNGRWSATSQGITFDTNGDVIDGGHRLTAVISADCAVEMRVTNGENPDNFQFYDILDQRSPSDVTILDPKDRTRNKYLVTITRAFYCAAVLKVTRKVSAEVLRDVFNAYKRGLVAVVDEGGDRLKKKNSNVMAAVAVYIAKHPGKGTAFLAKLTGKADVPANDPAMKLLGHLSVHGFRSGMDDYWYAVSACKADLEGRPLTKLVRAADDMAGNRLVKVERMHKKRGEKAWAARSA